MGVRGLLSYHLAWLSTHPHRDSEWLSSRLADGFDVHHIDGNHSNDSPENLVLIECIDHMMLHGAGHKMCRLRPAKAQKYVKTGYRYVPKMPRPPKLQADERLALYKTQRDQYLTETQQNAL